MDRKAAAKHLREVKALALKSSNCVASVVTDVGELRAFHFPTSVMNADGQFKDRTRFCIMLNGYTLTQNDWLTVSRRVLTLSGGSARQIADAVREYSDPCRKW